MIILDTNVVSEMMKGEPADAVSSWYKKTARHHLFTTAVTRAEILAGIAVLPDGRKRADLAGEANVMFAEDFEGRILPFDSIAADEYADIIGNYKRRGRHIKPLDAQIAAIARGRMMALATRNSRDFKACGIELVNPWDT